MSEKLEWEIVTRDEYECTERLTIPQGWLYRTRCLYENDEQEHYLVSMVFVPERFRE
jgi:hypothetical protein